MLHPVQWKPQPIFIWKQDLAIWLTRHCQGISTEGSVKTPTLPVTQAFQPIRNVTMNIPPAPVKSSTPFPTLQNSNGPKDWLTLNKSICNGMYSIMSEICNQMRQCSITPNHQAFHQSTQHHAVIRLNVHEETGFSSVLNPLLSAFPVMHKSHLVHVVVRRHDGTTLVAIKTSGATTEEAARVVATATTTSTPTSLSLLLLLLLILLIIINLLVVVLHTQCSTSVSPTTSPHFSLIRPVTTPFRLMANALLHITAGFACYCLPISSTQNWNFIN